MYGGSGVAVTAPDEKLCPLTLLWLDKAKQVSSSSLVHTIIKFNSYTQATSHILPSMAPKTNSLGFGFYFE